MQAHDGARPHPAKGRENQTDKGKHMLMGLDFFYPLIFESEETLPAC